VDTNNPLPAPSDTPASQGPDDGSPSPEPSNS